jgi:hypothetical protein
MHGQLPPVFNLSTGRFPSFSVLWSDRALHYRVLHEPSESLSVNIVTGFDAMKRADKCQIENNDLKLTSPRLLYDFINAIGIWSD